MFWLRRRREQGKPSPDFTIERERDGTLVVHLAGTLTAAAVAKVQHRGAQELKTGGKANLLVMLDDDFRGFGRSPALEDITFMLEHDTEAIRMAIVGDSKWETDFLAFTGAGHRRARIQFFPGEDLRKARMWLSGDGTGGREPVPSGR